MCQFKTIRSFLNHTVWNYKATYVKYDLSSNKRHFFEVDFLLNAAFVHLRIFWGSGPGGGGGHMSKFWQGCSSLFLGLKFGQILFFWVGKCFSYFSEFCKISAIFLGLTNFQLFFFGLPIFVSHTWILWMKNTVLKNKIIVAFHIYSNFDHHFSSWVILFFWVWILGHSIFLGLNLESFYFMGSWNLFSDEHPCQRNACVPNWGSGVSWRAAIVRGRCLKEGIQYTELLNQLNS